MTCLLCGQHLKSNLTFSNLLLLKNEETSVCLTCFESFERIGEEHCPNCHKKGLSTSCKDCQVWCKEGIDVNHQAIFVYNQAMKDFFSRYKFDGDYILRKIFASILKDFLINYKDYHFILIPLSHERYAKRGFNQVAGLIEATGLSYEKLLEKREEKASSSKTRSERLATELPFFIKDCATVPKKILLIDDIYTTGVTLNRVKKLLENAGAEEVRTFSLVR
ncbi:ComF family protein [Streptococcus sp. Z554]